MSEPHVPSDDTAILRAHDRRFANAQMSFDAAVRVCREKPVRWNVEKVKQAMLGLADEYAAGLERQAGRETGAYPRLTQETIDAPPSISRVEAWEDGPVGACMSDKAVTPRKPCCRCGKTDSNCWGDAKSGSCETHRCAWSSADTSVRVQNGGITHGEGSPIAKLCQSQDDFGRRGA